MAGSSSNWFKAGSGAKARAIYLTPTQQASLGGRQAVLQALGGGAAVRNPVIAMHTPPKGVAQTRQSQVPGGNHVFGFGKHRGQTVAQVAQHNPSYLTWMQQQVGTNTKPGSAQAQAMEAIVQFQTAQAGGASAPASTPTPAPPPSPAPAPAASGLPARGQPITYTNMRGAQVPGTMSFVAAGGSHGVVNRQGGYVVVDASGRAITPARSTLSQAKAEATRLASQAGSAPAPAAPAPAAPAPAAPAKPTAGAYQMTFGKYAKTSLDDIYRSDPDYVQALATSPIKSRTRSMAERFLKDQGVAIKAPAPRTLTSTDPAPAGRAVARPGTDRNTLRELRDNMRGPFDALEKHGGSVPAPPGMIGVTVNGQSYSTSTIIQNLVNNGGGRGDLFLAEIQKAHGFDQKPTLVGKTEFNKLAKSGAFEEVVYRGAGGAQFAQEYQSGELFSAHYRNSRMYGAGAYTASGGRLDQDRKNAFAVANGSYSSGAKSVLRMGLRKGARVADWAGAITKRDQWVAKEERALKAALDGGKVRKSSYEAQNRALAMMKADVGYWAAAMGYDAIRVPKGTYNTGFSVTVVLNRGAVVIQKELE